MGSHPLSLNPKCLYQGNAIEARPAFDRSDILIASTLAILALLLRIPGLDNGIWYDEIWTLLDFVRLSVPEIVYSPGGLNNHVLYSVSAHFTTTLFGESVWALRLPALIFGVLTVPAMYYLGLQLTSRYESLLATTFIVFSYHHVWFSQNARGYTGATLGAVIASILFIRLITSPKPGARLVAGYALVVALTAWIHLTGLAIGIAHCVVWLGLTIWAVKGGRFRNTIPCAVALILSTALVLLLYSPIISQTVASFSPVNAVAPVTFEWESGAWTLSEFRRGITTALPGGWAAAIVIIVILVTGVIAEFQRGFVHAGLLLLPVLVPITIALVAMNAFFPRFIFFTLPFILFIGVIGGFKLAPIITPFLSTRQALLAGLTVALLAGIRVPEAWGPKQDFLQAASFIEENQQADSAFVCIGLTYMPMVDYLGSDCLGVKSLDDLKHIESRYKKTWLINTLPIYMKNRFPEIATYLEANYQVTKTLTGTLEGGDITIMIRNCDGTDSGACL